ncbi:MAG: hypothetical protein ACYC4A_05950 [Desulfobulbia bacterium]
MNAIKTILLLVATSAILFIAIAELHKKTEEENLMFREQTRENIKKIEGTLTYIQHHQEFIYQDMLERGSVAECKNNKTIIDLKKGTLGGLSPNASPETIKKKFPCFTYSGENDYGKDHGGGVFYGDHSFYFYTREKSINIRKKFRGTIDGGNDSAQFMNYIKHDMSGIEKMMTDYNFDLVKKIPFTRRTSTGQTSMHVYRTPYGCLAIKFKTNELDEINITSKSCEESGFLEK